MGRGADWREIGVAADKDGSELGSSIKSIEDGEPGIGMLAIA